MNKLIAFCYFCSLFCYAAEFGGLKPNWEYNMYINGEWTCTRVASPEGTAKVPLPNGQNTIELKEIGPYIEPTPCPTIVIPTPCPTLTPIPTPTIEPTINPTPTPIPLLQTTLIDQYDFTGGKYMVIEFEILTPKSLDSMDIYVKADKEVLEVKAGKSYSSDNYHLWHILYVPKQDMSEDVRLELEFNFNGVKDYRYIVIQHGYNTEDYTPADIPKNTHVEVNQPFPYGCGILYKKTW